MIKNSHTPLKCSGSVPVQHVLPMHSFVLSSLAAQCRPSPFYATNAAWQEHSVHKLKKKHLKARAKFNS